MRGNNFVKRCILIISALIFFGIISVAAGFAADKTVTDKGTVYKKDDSILAKNETIYGTVKDAKTKMPVAGAIVELKNANFGLGYYKTKTDFLGRFKIDDFIRHIKYKIEVSAEGYNTYQYTSEIQPGEFKIILEREGVLTGVVTDSANRPLGGVEVKLDNINSRRYHDEEDNESSSSDSKPTLVVTAKDGTYKFNKIEAGGYVASFQKAGFIKETAQIRHIDNGESISLPMQLFKTASISGKITIEDLDIPAPNINITLKGLQTYSTVNYQDGSFSIDDVKPGNYKLSMDNRGFNTLETATISIKEGESRKSLNYVLKPKQPEVEVYSDRYTFVIGQQLNFNLKAFRLEKVKVRIYRLPIAIALNGRADSNKIQPDKDGLQKIREWDEAIKDFTAYEWREQTIDIAEPLPPGGYCIEVAGENNLFDRKFFSVTSIGIVVKRSMNSIFTYATDLATNKPVSGATIIFFDVPPEKKQVVESQNTNDNDDEVTSDEEETNGNDGNHPRRARHRHHEYQPPVRLEDLPVTIIKKGVTDSDGILQLPLKAEKLLAVMAVASDGSYAFCNAGSTEEFNQEKDKIFIYTDRPVYRAGDKVYYKIIGKAMGNKSIPMKDKKLFYQIKNTDVDEVMLSGSFSLNNLGTYKGEFNLSDSTRLGTYEILVGPEENNLYGMGKFFVDQYRKPEFKIDISSTKEYYINRDTVEFKVEAKYLFGSPLKGALVKYRFYESRLRDNDTKYWWEEDQEQSHSYNKIKLEGDKYLDDNGIAVLKLSSGDFPYDRELTLEVTIVDRSNISISESSTVKVGRGDFYIKIKPGQSFYAYDEAKPIEIKTVAHNGKPRSANVDVKVFRYIWKPWQRVYVHDKVPVFSTKITTDSSGTANIELPKDMNFYGEFDIVAESKDKKNNTITASRVVWIYSSSSMRVESRLKNLELSLSETALEKPGEITCLIKSRFTDSYVCLTIEGKDIYEKKVVLMNGNILPVKLNIKPEYAPNVFITATMQRGRALFTSTAEVTLPNADVSMNIDLKTDKEKYLPGEKIKIDIKTTDENGKPLAGDVSLGVVDEAIYLIRRDHTPKMRNFFYSKNSNWVLTNYSYPFTILAGAGKEGKVKIREKFVDTAYWNPEISTNENGMASVDFVLPDNLTTWRLTARAHDLLGRVGEKKETTLVTQDLIARIGKPRFFIEGDKIELIGIINSNTDRGLSKLKTEFRFDNNLIESEEKVKLSIPAFGIASSYYNISIPQNKSSVDVFFKAIGDANAKDALKVNIPVYSRGTSFKLYGVGDMMNNRTVELSPLKDTDDFEFKPQDLIISLNPSPISQLLRGSDYLANFPYGCIEQTLNGFMPALALRNLLQQKGLSAPRNEKLNEKIDAGIKKIMGYQNDDGSWGWWGGDAGNDYITGYVLYSLHLAKNFGFAVDENKINKALSSVERVLNSNIVNYDDAKMFLFYTNSLWGRWHEKTYEEFIKKQNLNAYCRAFLIMSMANANKIDKFNMALPPRPATGKTEKEEKELQTKYEAEIKNILQVHKDRINSQMKSQITALKNMQKKDNYGVYWEREGNQMWGWPGGNTEITAHVLAALAAAHDTSTMPPQIVSSLMRRSKGAAWKSTKETATVIFSICKYYQEMNIRSSGSGSVSFKLDGIKVGTINYDSDSLHDANKLTKKVKMARVNQDHFKVEASGNADADVSFNLIINGDLYFKESRFDSLSKSGENPILDFSKSIALGFLSFFKSENRSLQTLDNGMSLARGFFSVTRVRDVNNNEYLVPQRIDNGRGIKIGDEILVKIKFRAMDDFEFLVLEDYLPAGFEVVKKNVYDEYQPYSHSERWDNRMVFFFNKIHKNEVYELGYTMRAELPGVFLAKPARIECMYEPSIQGWSKPAKFTVNKK